MDELTREVMGLSNTLSKEMPSMTTIRQEKVELAKLDRCSNNAKLRRCVEPNYAVAQLHQWPGSELNKRSEPNSAQMHQS